MPRLREHGNDLFALVSSASESRNIPAPFIEKDFWITEILRAAVVAAESAKSMVILKGGTSLSKAFQLLRRFSEDVDILLVPPERAGETARDTIMKRIAAAIGDQLGIKEGSQHLQSSGRGIHRNIQYIYPRQFESREVENGVLLEMGIRGGADPHREVRVRSIVAEYALSRGTAEDEYEEFASMQVAVLAPERTLVEKLALLHHLASNAKNEREAVMLRRAGRHYYDIYYLLGHDDTLGAIHEGQLVKTLASDVEAHTKKSGWGFTGRPDAGYATSPAFDMSLGPEGMIVAAYRDARALFYGPFPDIKDCTDRVQEFSKIL